MRYTAHYFDWDELTHMVRAEVARLLGDDYGAEITRSDFYFWDLVLVPPEGQEMTETLSEELYRKLGLTGGYTGLLADDLSIEKYYLRQFLAIMIGEREVSSSHADDNGVWIICKP